MRSRNQSPRAPEQHRRGGLAAQAPHDPAVPPRTQVRTNFPTIEMRQNFKISRFSGFWFSRKLLVNSGHIDVSYFAAGIIAHLASDGPEAWKVDDFDREALLKELATVVLQWGMPEGEMVAYRSFHPFFPLLARHDTYQVQLWAAWAIQHVCAKNGEPRFLRQFFSKIFLLINK